MKQIAISMFALVAAGVFSPVNAADAHARPDSLKDSGSPAIARGGHGGWYVTGFVGYSWGDRDIHAKTNRELGAYYDMTAPVAPVEKDFDKDGDGKLSEGERAALAEANEKYADDKARFDDCVEEFLAAAPGSSFDGSSLTLPLLGDLLTNAANSDANSFVYGAEISRLFHNGGPLGLELAAGVTFYADDKTGVSWNRAHGVITYPAPLAGEPVPDINGIFGQTGTATAERQLDIDLLARGYWFVRPDLALTLGGGVSFAKAELCASNTSDGVALLQGTGLHDFAADAFNHGGCATDWSIGPVGEVGFKWWASDRLAIVGRLDVKEHSFKTNVGSSARIGEAVGDNCCNVSEVGIYGKSGTVVEVDDLKWAAKVGISYNLSGLASPLE